MMKRGEEFTHNEETWVCITDDDDGCVVACKKADWDKASQRGAPLYCLRRE